MKSPFPRWLIYALLCIFWWGIFGFLSKIGSDKLPPGQVQIWFTFGTFPLLVPALLRSRVRVGTDKLGVTYGTLTGFLAGIGNLALFAALENGKASIVGPVTTLYPLVSVILAVIVLQERTNRWQFIGVILAVAAIFILSL
jgi:bacterial/archaeal transporter family protein